MNIALPDDISQRFELCKTRMGELYKNLYT